MWVVHRETLGSARGEKAVIVSAGRVLSFADVIAGWRDDENFRAFFIAELAATPYPAFFWEMPPVRRAHLSAAYEYVAIRGGSLARLRADPGAFASKLHSVGGSNPVASFRNLSGDALLVVPRRIAEPESYGHLAAFVRSAPLAQRHALFRELGCAIHRTLQESDDRIWVSTSGLGVPWLHIRLDSYPKYYNHQPYANA